MRLFSSAALVAAITLAATATTPADQAPVDCSGSLLGDELTTTAEFKDGYALVAPWKVVHAGAAERTPGVRSRVFDVHLDRVIERESSGRSVTTPFPAPVETTFEGKSEDDLVFQAAQVWCVTVIKVKAQGVELVPEATRPPVVRASARPGALPRLVRAL